MNYGDGSMYNYNALGPSAEEFYNYSQILFDVNIYDGPWSLHSQIEFSDPPEIGISFKGLRRFTFSYDKDKYNILIGDIYKSWGKGLVLSQYDDISIGYDNGIRGAAISYNYFGTNIEFLTGNKKIRNFTNFSSISRIPDRSTTNNLIGMRVDRQLGNIEIGISTLTNIERFSINSFGSDSSLASHNLNSFSGSYFGENFDLSLEYANKYTAINPAIMQIEFDLTTFESDTIIRKSHYGSGLAFSSNYIKSIFSFSFDYAYYSFLVSDPSFRSSMPLPEGVSQFQKPMIISQEYPSVLLNRLTHLQDNNDEVGLNFVINISVGEGGSFTLNSSYSSRTKEWYRELESDFITSKWKIKKENYFTPSRGISSSPYQQHTISYESFFERGNYQITFSKIDEIKTLYENDISDTYEKSRYDIIDAITIPFSMEYNFKEDYSFIFKAGYQEMKKGIQTDFSNTPNIFVSYYENIDGAMEQKQHTYAASLGISKSSKWSIIFNIERDEHNEADGVSENFVINPLEKIFDPFFDSLDRTWISTELTYRFENSLRLSMFYGSNRGGVSCANGICRYYPGFTDGFRMQLTKSFY